MAQYTIYPNGIDSSNQLPISTDDVTPVKAEVVNRHREAIIAIESELGIQPSGTYTTVRARLDAIDALIATITGGLGALSQVLKDGASVRTNVSEINFIGTSVTVTAATESGRVDVTITGGGGGTQTLAQTLAFGNTTGGNNISFSSGDNIRLDTIDGTAFSIAYQSAASTIPSAFSITGQPGGAGNTGGGISIVAGSGGSASSGGTTTIAGGGGTGAGSGGNARLRGGAGGTTGAGGTAILAGGDGGSVSGNAGDARVQGGTPVDGNGGSITLDGANGVGTNRTGGSITGTAGNSTGSTIGGAISFTAGQGGTTAKGGTITLTAGAGGSVSGDGGDIHVIPGTATSGTDGKIILDGYTEVLNDLSVTGKLTVTGLIDPTAVVFSEQASAPAFNAIWIRNTSPTSFVFTDNLGDDHTFSTAATQRHIAVAGRQGTDAVSPGYTNIGATVFDPTEIDGYIDGYYLFQAVLETTSASLPAEILLYNITDGIVVTSFSSTPLTTTSVAATLLERVLNIGTDIPAKKVVYQARIRFASGSPGASDQVTCNLAQIAVS